jgi:hypothetical protein
MDCAAFLVLGIEGRVFTEQSGTFCHFKATWDRFGMGTHFQSQHLLSLAGQLEGNESESEEEEDQVDNEGRPAAGLDIPTSFGSKAAMVRTLLHKMSG